MEFHLKQDKARRLNLYKNDSRYLTIIEVFEEYFRKRTELTKVFFNNNIWFLSGDKILRKLIQNNIQSFQNSNNNDDFNNNSTPIPLSIFHEILFELNENKDDFKNLKIKFISFFERISQELLFCHELQARSQGLINQYKAQEMMNVIEQNKQRLKHKNSQEELKFDEFKNSKIHFVLKNITNFPIGSYTVEAEFIELCDKESDRETAYTGKTVATIFENKKSVFINKKLKVEKEKTCIDLINNKEMDFYKIDEFELRKFLPDEREVKIPNISGTTLQEIHINFYKENGELLGVVKKNFIILLLMNIEKITDIRHDNININLISRLETDDENNDSRIDIEFSLKFDPMTRLSVLENIYKILTNVIEMNTLYHNNIFEILSYFGEIRELIENILNSPTEEKKSSCNSCECNIL